MTKKILTNSIEFQEKWITKNIDKNSNKYIGIHEL
jgi:hypothetical protein